MSPNEKFAWVASAMVAGFSLVICLAPGMWLAIAAAVLLMVCFTAAARLERAGGSLHRDHWYYLIPLVIAPSLCVLIDHGHALWVGLTVSFLGGLATHVLARAFPVIADQPQRQQVLDR